MNRNKSSIFIIACLAVLTVGPLAGGQPPTNEQVVVSAVKSACEKEFNESRGSRLRIITTGTGLEGLVSTGIAAAMRSKYLEVVLAGKPDSLSDNLFFDLAGFDMSYKEGEARGFMKGHAINRRLRSLLLVTIRQGVQGQILDQKSLDIEYSDTIDPSMMNAINSDYLPQLAPKAPGSDWSKYAAPAVFAVSAGVIMYLYFAHR